MKSYHFKFDVYALILFVVMMIPNIIWLVLPNPNDMLKMESETPVLDIIGSVAQVLMIALLVLFQRKDSPEKMPKVWKWITIVSTLIYYAAWMFYFPGAEVKALAVVLLTLAIAPCFAFASFAVGRKNWLALSSCAVFFVCHLIFAQVN